MDIRKAVGWAKGHRNGLVVVALVLVFAGADLLLNRPENLGFAWLWFSLPFLVAGFALLALIVWPTTKPGPRPPGDTLAHRLLWWGTRQGRMIPFLPLIGIGVILADLGFNAIMSSTPALLTHDQVVLLFGAVLIGYRFVPKRYGRERDFVLLFTFSLTAILAIPLAVLRLLTNPTASVDAYSAAALAPQTSGLLGLLGVPNQVVHNEWGTPGLSFRTAAGANVTVYITSACSGVYSFAIFASAFTAFVLTEQRRVTGRVLAFFAAGILLAYVANVLRMVVIIWIGYRFDTPGTQLDNLMIAHSYAGWLIFLAWIALFWFLLFRFLKPEAPGVTRTRETSPDLPRRRGTFCGICEIVLTPAIPAARCRCGEFYHVDCWREEGRCPSCLQPLPNSTLVDHSTS